MTILVQENKEESNYSIITSKDIICPKCGESAKFDITDYKIILQCVKGHNIGNVLLNQFEKTQKIDLSKIICEDCKKNNKAKSYQNIFYRCNQCNIAICIQCQSKHKKENNDHSFINYDDKNYICRIHNEKYVSYCQNCEKNICLYCKKKHQEHKLINYENILPDMIEEKDNINKLNNDINKFKEVIDDLIKILNNVKDNFQKFYQIKKNIFDSLNNKCINYEMLYSYNKINESQIFKDVNYIINNKNKMEIFKKLNEINDKSDIKNEYLYKPSNADKNKLTEKVLEKAVKSKVPVSFKISDILNKDKKKNIDKESNLLEKEIPPQIINKNNQDTDYLNLKKNIRDDSANKPIDDSLKNWVNDQLRAAGYNKELTNFGDDLKDGQIYTILLNFIFPKDCDKSPLDEKNINQRIEKILDNTKKIVDSPLTKEDLCSGNEIYGRLFIGEIYNAFCKYNVNEKECYCKIINKLLENEEELKSKLPIDPQSDEVFTKIKDGVILAKLINIAEPGTIDERVITKDPKMTIHDNNTNINLVINSAKSIGCLTEATKDDILNGVKRIVIDLIYQILKLIIYKKISLKEFPQMFRFKQEKEEVEDLLKLGKEDFIKRWFNYHLANIDYPNQLKNFREDLKDSEKYILLLNILNKKYDKSALNNNNLLERANKVLESAQKLGANIYIKNIDIISGNEHLNLFFLAELFIANNGLGNATQQEKMIAFKLLDDDEEGIREERIFRIWINSLKLKGVKEVNYLYEECRNGILLLKIIDLIKPGTVYWKIVELKNLKNPFKVGVNCQEVIDACKKSDYKIVGIVSGDIKEGKKKYILTILRELMKAYILKKIGGVSEDELIKWANSLIPDNMKINNLSKKKLGDGLFWIYLLAAIDSNCIKKGLYAEYNHSDKSKEMNAKYILSVARGLGAMNYISWENITEVNSYFLLTLLASLYKVAK